MSYGDGESETVNMSHERWCFSAFTASIGLTHFIASDQPVVIHFANKPVQGHNVRGFLRSFLTVCSALKKMFSSKRYAWYRFSPFLPMPTLCHYMWSRKSRTTMEQLKLKCRIGSHANDDSPRHEVNSDCSMCSPVGLGVIISTSSLRK